MDEARPSDNLGHAIFENIRGGDWLMDYSVSRLKPHRGTADVAIWLEQVFIEMKKLPRYLIPAYFEKFIRIFYNSCVQQIAAKFNNVESKVPTSLFCLKNRLALGSVQLMGLCKTAPLAPLVPEGYTSSISDLLPSLSAGLPHFSEGIWRNWGRDTFIALRGLLVLNKRYDEAKNIIVSYGATMRHGLIPNLLGGGSEVARYNCRDAFWWWINSIRHLCHSFHSSDDVRAFLNQKVARIYPDDVTGFEAMSNSPYVFTSLADLIQEGLQRHVDGIRFVERNAGPKIDNNMSTKGFAVDVSVDPATGFVIGGNKWNCGTWMDKMGGSERAANKGVPATPRDGAAVELQGLCYACVSWLAQLFTLKIFAHEGVLVKNRSMLKYSSWASNLAASFDCHFFIDTSPNERYNDVSLVNRTQIYKDTLGSQNPWTDYQLRPNYAVAIAEAPDLCNTENAWAALETMEKMLLGPLGMKTLDPSDWKYNGKYDNDRDDSNFDLAKGFNYHNGPEWLWLTGFFFRAKLAIARKRSKAVDETKETISKFLTRLSEHLDSSPWRGVTELTNQNGELCPFSSPTQAWSFAAALELIHELTE